ncbi:UDP:flavonoid glycosyltransferase YjiC (YdhE family) [Roseiarcus fermentans]|uniref:UDP:flavonoid glycosyltransferase YjiC (YdhE family) n=1 Tax=Roseiarcus fermentans TaxID=1473586 RepID=A0A366F4F7_9HYPH|nr:hypothetical protein [Roseiarcus fermentans]RBP08649.1 UDP:flavonoid glycosyltransferase YjiC (YdhE family) [Roseiarcus fermentans]
MSAAGPRRRILIAWELGGGYGHVHRMLPLADRLVADGHEASLAVQSVETGRALLGDRRHPLLAAPAARTIARPVRIESWADIVFNAGYDTAESAAGMVGGWLGVVQDSAADLVVAEFSPGALLAARIAGVPAVSVGSGWGTPPAATPLPAIRFWQPPAPETLAASEARLLDALNPALRALGGAPLPNLAALVPPEDNCLCSFPELDHYPDRGGVGYCGPVYAEAEGGAPRWPAASGPRCLAYLSGAHPALPALLGGIGGTGFPTALHLRGGLPSHATIPPNVWLAPGPLRLDLILPERPIVVCQGLNLMSAALAAGCPVLAAPEHLEQTALANRLLLQRLGLALDPKQGAGDAAALLGRLAEEPQFRQAAAGFATHYAGYAPAMAVDAVVEDCLDRLG